jgi:hypothetical protein
VINHCGGVSPLRNERRDGTLRRSHKFRNNDHSRNFWPHQPEEDDGDKSGPARTLSGSRSGRAALRREQRERLESKHSDNPSHGEEGETKHSPREEMAVCLSAIRDDYP